jgi:hypothetical protein
MCLKCQGQTPTEHPAGYDVTIRGGAEDRA